MRARARPSSTTGRRSGSRRTRWRGLGCEHSRAHVTEAISIQAAGARLSSGHRMELSKKVKIALDETRMLILGAQILLGFQFRGPFSDGFDQLPTGARYLDGLALGLMVCVVGLLIAPGPYHRIVEGGADSSQFPPRRDGHRRAGAPPLRTRTGPRYFRHGQPHFR